MLEPKLLDFTWTDGVNHDVLLAENSNSIKLVQNYKWSIQPIPDTVVGTSPLYTVQVSNDDIDWDDYDVLSTNVDIINAVDDTHLAFNYVRIVHIPNGVTSGNVTYKINLKRG